MDVFDLKGSYRHAMHGGGAFKGLRQTNTREAIVYWYGKGVRVFELDFAPTADGQFVAVAHSMDDRSLNRLEILELPSRGNRTASWFMGQKLFPVSTRGLNPVSLDTVADLLEKCPDCIFMLDLFGMFSFQECRVFTAALLERLPDAATMRNRILVEAYNRDMADGIQTAWQDANVIYCVRYEGNLDANETIPPEELLSRGIRFVSYPWYCTRKHPGELQSYSQAGITVFSRTKFNTLDNTLRDAGVSVDIVAVKFDGIGILWQFPLYMATYLKRMAVKIRLAARRRKRNMNQRTGRDGY